MKAHCYYTGIVFGLMLALHTAAQAGNPAILFCNHGNPPDLVYLAELTQKGFDVDYTTDYAEITADRIKQYNVLVITMTPDAYDVTMRRIASSPEKAKSFADMIENYVTAGGGVLLMPHEYNILKQVVSDLTDRWGAKLPVEQIKENDAEKVAIQSHLAAPYSLAYTDQVLPSPVSDGVKQIWYPPTPAYFAGHTGPICVDDNWQIVVKASKTSVSVPVDLSKCTTPIPKPFSRPEGVKEPPFVAIRSYKAGRIGLINQWDSYSFGSGTKWLFNREVLSRGMKGKPSDFGRLLENMYRWLAEPSVKSGTLGGFAARSDKLVPPNYRPEAKKQFDFTFWHYERETLGYGQPPKDAKLYRGLIGARTAFSSGQGTVAEYAQAAQAVGLDFVVFLEEFAKLTPERLQKLKEECAKYSTDKLQLIAGFCIRNNIGNYMFFFGSDPVWPPEVVRSATDKSLISITEQNAKGEFTGLVTPFLDWVIQNYHNEKHQAGYYNFGESPVGIKLSDCRAYAMGAIRYYRDGKLVEDVTEDYLTTAQCTIAPAPVSVNEVTSPQALTAEVNAGRGLTFAQARSLATLMPDALRWTCQYDAMNVFQRS